MHGERIIGETVTTNIQISAECRRIRIYDSKINENNNNADYNENIRKIEGEREYSPLCWYFIVNSSNQKILREYQTLKPETEKPIAYL